MRMSVHNGIGYPKSDIAGAPLHSLRKIKAIANVIFNPMRSIFSLKDRIAGLLIFAGTMVVHASADTGTGASKALAENPGGGWWYGTIGIIAIVALGVAAYLWRRSRKNSAQPHFDYEARYRNNYNNQTYDMEGVDAEKELEWLRKAKKAGAKPAKRTISAKPVITHAKPAVATSLDRSDSLNLDLKIFQEKMRKLQYAQLPINSFDNLSPAKLYEPLPLSNDQSLTNAIEQANEEFEEDETVRDLALRILTAFRTRNSVESLSQIALYDLSSNLRSKAVSTLTDFDHESVFEPILLACADPTREVRAAAARGLFRLNFDRADAWKRIIESNDEFRMSHAARAATESGIVVKSFDRLVHDDLKVAYEAFALVALLIRAGETQEIFEAIKSHKDERVRFALLHVLKVQHDERTLDALHAMQKDSSFPTDVAERIRNVINSFDAVTA